MATFLGGVIGWHPDDMRHHAALAAKISPKQREEKYKALVKRAGELEKVASDIWNDPKATGANKLDSERRELLLAAGYYAETPKRNTHRAHRP